MIIDIIESYLQKRSSCGNFICEVGKSRKICKLSKNTEIYEWSSQPYFEKTA
jgi:hypothetical protein